MSRQSAPQHRTRAIQVLRGFEVLEDRQLLATYSVTNILDSGPGSLREGLLSARTGIDPTIAITFNIPGPGVHAILPLSPLPTIESSLSIDGTTQPGYAGKPLVAIDGTYAGVTPGLQFEGGSGGGSVKGLGIERFLMAGLNSFSPNTRIQSNYIGIDPATDEVAANHGAGILALGSNVTIGGTTAAEGNVISGNTRDGIELDDCANVLISHNLIGADLEGRTNVGNGGRGVTIINSQNTTLNSNTISNNGSDGLGDIGTGTVSTNNIIANNNNSSLTANVVLNASRTSVITSTGQIETILYTITNQGPNVATDVRLTLSAGFASLPGTTSNQQVIKALGAESSQGSIAPGLSLTSVSSPFSNPGFANLGTIAPGGTAAVKVAFSIVGSGTDSLYALAVGDQPYVQGTHLQETTIVQSIGNADISVKALAPPTAIKVGVLTKFTFQVTNNDPKYTTFAPLAINLGLTPGATLQFFDAGSIFLYGPPNQAVDNPNLYEPVSAYGLPAGATATVIVGIIPIQPGKVIIQFAGSSNLDIDPNPNNNLALIGTIAELDPTVTGATLVPTTGPVQSVAVDFDAALNATQAKNVKNYRLSTTDQPGGIAIKSAIYNAKTHVVTLRLDKTLSRSGTPISLVVGGPKSPGLTGSDGSKLLGGSSTTTIKRS